MESLPTMTYCYHYWPALNWSMIGPWSYQYLLNLCCLKLVLRIVPANTLCPFSFWVGLVMGLEGDDLVEGVVVREMGRKEYGKYNLTKTVGVENLEAEDLG